jgi:hypothetical protein
MSRKCKIYSRSCSKNPLCQDEESRSHEVVEVQCNFDFRCLERAVNAFWLLTGAAKAVKILKDDW